MEQVNPDMKIIKIKDKTEATLQEQAPAMMPGVGKIKTGIQNAKNADVKKY